MNGKAELIWLVRRLWRASVAALGWVLTLSYFGWRHYLEYVEWVWLHPAEAVGALLLVQLMTFGLVNAVIGAYMIAIMVVTGVFVFLAMMVEAICFGPEGL